MNIKKAVLIVVSLACVAVVSVVAINISMAKKTEQDFVSTAKAYAEGIISGEYEQAIALAYFSPEYINTVEDLKNMFETEGSGMVDYKIDKVNKLSDKVYQIEGSLTSSHGYTEQYIPFYFKMEGKWHMALNEYQLPEGYLENLDYISFENGLDPKGLTVFDLG